MLSRWVSINDHCSSHTSSPHRKGKKMQPEPYMGGRVTNWKDLSGSGWCPVWWRRVGKMIMNYQITLLAIKEWVCYYQLPQGGVHNLVSWLYSQNYPITCLDRPIRLQKTEVPGFLDSRHMKVVRTSALLAGRVYPHSPRITPSYLFLLETECAPEPYCGQKD